MKDHDDVKDLYFFRLSIIVSMLLKVVVFFTVASTAFDIICLFLDEDDPNLRIVLRDIIRCAFIVIAEIISAYSIQVFCELVMYLHNISESLEEMNLKGNSSNQSHNVSTDDDSFEALVNSYEENQ